MNPFLEEALKLAGEAATQGEVPVGAVVVQNGIIIGRGHNRRESDQNPVAHAEVMALIDASKNLNSWRLETCELWVTLEPCPMCLGAIQQARIARVVYGASDPKGGALSLGYRLHEDLKTNHRFQVELQSHAECGQILSRFFTARRSSGKE